jgi:hypothetical protein
MWRHGQAVRQRSAKPLFPGPIPGGASIYANVAQSVEQRTRNAQVSGSIPLISSTANTLQT